MSDETLDDANENESIVLTEIDSGIDSDSEIDAFEQLVLDVENEPGCAGFPRLAEAYRRDGQIERARAVRHAAVKPP